MSCINRFQGKQKCKKGRKPENPVKQHLQYTIRLLRSEEKIKYKRLHVNLQVAPT